MMHLIDAIAGWSLVFGICCGLLAVFLGSAYFLITGKPPWH